MFAKIPFEGGKAPVTQLGVVLQFQIEFEVAEHVLLHVCS